MKTSSQTTHKIRKLTQITKGMETSDGDGVNMTRLIGTSQLNYLDPFLMLDAFGSDEPLDYIGGFPSHPHRGFETVTYLLAGRMRHKDNAGNEGVIKSGGVQWMTAGKGIVHSEMPEQEDGLLKGFQLWVNLPARAKMIKPNYQEFSPAEVPIEYWDNGTKIRVIAGKTAQGTIGIVKNNYVNPNYMDITLQVGKDFEQVVDSGDNSFIYVIEGSLEVGKSADLLSEKELGILSDGNLITLKAKSNHARFILISGQPLNEPIARGGPFVMNTQAEIKQAFADFRANKF